MRESEGSCRGVGRGISQSLFPFSLLVAAKPSSDSEVVEITWNEKSTSPTKSLIFLPNYHQQL